jgi:hypothetical protein
MKIVGTKKSNVQGIGNVKVRHWYPVQCADKTISKKAI